MNRIVELRKAFYHTEVDDVICKAWRQTSCDFFCSFMRLEQPTKPDKNTQGSCKMQDEKIADHIRVLLGNPVTLMETQLHCESKKLGHFYFYCNFVKCWPILIILLLSEPEIISAVI